MSTTIPPPKFTWGDEVRVQSSAPAEFRPGEQAVVCAITEPGFGRETYFYTAEFLDGSSLHIAEPHLEADKEP